MHLSRSEDSRKDLFSPDDERLPMQRVKVALFIPNFRIGGAERQLFELAKHLDKHKYKVSVIALHGDGELKDLFSSLPNLELVSLADKTSLSRFWKLIRVMRRSQIQVLHSFLRATNVYALFVRLFLHRVRVVIGLRDSLDDSTFGCSSAFLRTKIRMIDLCLEHLRPLGDLYISNSEAGKNVYERKLRVDVSVIPNGIDTERFKPDETAHSLLCRLVGAPAEAQLVGILANFSLHKDYPTFIRAARIIMQKIRAVHFISIGENRTPIGAAVKNIVQESGLQSNFHFLGTRKDVSELLPGLDVLCSSSVTEGFSNSIAEAMACCVPCVVTDVGDSRRIVGDTGMVVLPGDPESLALSVATLLNMDPEERQRFRSSARKRILENFDAYVMAEQYGRLYDSLITGSRSDDLVDHTSSSNLVPKSTLEGRKAAQTYR